MQAGVFLVISFGDGGRITGAGWQYLSDGNRVNFGDEARRDERGRRRSEAADGID